MSGYGSDEEKYAVEANGNAGASLTTPAQASSLRKGGFVMLKQKPCKILEISTSKTGKHGHAKCAFRGTDIFTNKGVEDICPSTHNMEVPVVRKTEFDVMDFSRDGYLSLLGEGGEQKNDVKVPEGEVGERIKSYLAQEKIVVVTILMAMGQEMAVAVKTIAE